MIFILSCVGITVNTSSQPLSPPSYAFPSPQLSTCDEQSANIALFGRMSSKVSEIERIELGTSIICSPVEEAQRVQEATDTDASSEILLPHTIPLKNEGNVVPGMD